MRLALMLLVTLVAANAAAHTQSPGKVEPSGYTFKEVNPVNFTLVNRNNYVVSYDVVVGDWDETTKTSINEKTLGTIESLKYNESIKFDVDIRVAPSSTRKATVCTVMNDSDAAYRSKVCSLVVLKRR